MRKTQIKKAIKDKKLLKQKYKNAFEVVKKHIDKLDPMCLLDIAPPDEYEFEVAEILPVAMRTKDVEVLANAIIKIFDRAFGEQTLIKKPLALETSKNILEELLEESQKPFYFTAERFFPTKEYEDFSAVKGKKEIVSYDCGLMGDIFTYDCLNKAMESFKKKDKQIIAVCETHFTDLSENLGNDFIFCGFDLCDMTTTSAIANCEGFETAIDYANLNDYGLIKEYKTAELSQNKLSKQFPNEPHADCKIYALWRKII